jgi:DNA-binding GntR family transcriptional regulator
LATESSTTLATLVYQQLRSDILHGSIPPGEKLRVEALSARYTTGATPIREALNRLCAEMIVERRENRGFYAKPISLEDSTELVETRCWIEGEALRRSIARRNQSWEDSIVLAFHHLKRTPRSSESESFHPNQEWERFHRAFHHALISNCGSQRLLHFCEELRSQADRYRKIAASYIYPNRDGSNEHEAILNAAIDGRSDEAVALLTRHYELTKQIVEERAKDIFQNDRAVGQ